MRTAADLDLGGFIPRWIAHQLDCKQPRPAFGAGHRQSDAEAGWRKAMFKLPAAR